MRLGRIVARGKGAVVVPHFLPGRVRLQRVEARGHEVTILWLADRGAAQVAGASEDDVFELLRRRRLDRRIDPGAALVDLAKCCDTQRSGAQILIEDRYRHLHPLGRGVGIDLTIDRKSVVWGTSV